MLHVYVVAVEQTGGEVLWLIPSDYSRRSTWRHNLQRWLRGALVPKGLGVVHRITPKLFVPGGGSGDVVLVQRRSVETSRAIGFVWPRSDDDAAYARTSMHAPWFEDWTARKRSSTKRKVAELVKGARLVRGALQQLTAATRERQTYIALGKAAMFAAVAKKSGQGPQCLIGIGVSNQAV